MRRKSKFKMKKMTVVGGGEWREKEKDRDNIFLADRTAVQRLRGIQTIIEIT